MPPANPDQTPPLPGEGGNPFPSASSVIPGPAPAPTTPVGGPQPAGLTKKKLILAAIVVAVLLLLGAIVAILSFSLLASIKLKTYTNAKYSMQVPAEYKQEVNGDSVNFTENEPEKTRSEVMVYYADFPSTLTDDQAATIKDTLRNQLKSAADDLAKDDAKKVEGLVVKETTFHAAPALQLTARVTEDGATVGKVTLVAVVDTQRLYMIGVAAHNSDKGLQKKTDAVIDSFRLK